MGSGETTATLKPRIKETTDNTEFKAAVGLSRKWDALEAGREVTADLLQKMGDKKPDFVLLFSTIHYKDHGGFQQLLNGIWELLPDETKLIGGTVTGFICPQGCFTRGVTLMGIHLPNSDIAIGIGHNTKRNPKKAAQKCINMIKEEIKNSKYKNLFLYEIVSGTKIPEVPGFGIRRVIKSKGVATLFNLLSDFSLKILQKGVGREDEILPEIVKAFPDAYLIGGSSFDDYRLLENYQFYNKKFFTDCILLLAIKSNHKYYVHTTDGLQKTNRKFRVTKTAGHGRTITKINNKPATEGWLEFMGWPKEVLNEKIHRKTFYTPVGFEYKGILYPNVPAFFWGESMLCGYKVKDNDHCLLVASGKSLLNAVSENMSKVNKKNNLVVLIVSCAVRLETLGSKIFEVREKIMSNLGHTPFICIYVTGEDTYSPEVGERHVNESFNVASIISD